MFLVRYHHLSPHPTTYYHVSATYWPSGLLNTLNTNLCNVPVWKYTPDGEGRVYSVGASSGQAPVSAILYNNFSQPLSITYGSSDSDNLSYDPNTGRMIQFLAAINGSTTQTGDLSWNANGTLAQLAINDASNSANTQTCAYTHDDITRLAKVDCGSGKWGQSFSFDVFGNISKANLSGRTGTNFQPTYAATTNHYQTLPSGSPAYDSNGNLTNDSFHTYAWDSDANVTTLDSTTTLIYDALDRRVERATSGVYTQTLYGPGGTKLALVNGATVAKVFVPLAGGATAVYTSSGLAYYRHPDWLGSSRLASTPSRTVYYDGAYAPFGENYAESGTTDRNFTGQNQDTATDLYDFLYREYHPTQGRWIQPDPAGLAAVDISNPQSWNRYGYVRNSPLASVDVNGLCSGDNGNFFDDDNHGTVWFHGPCSGGPIGTDPDTVNVSGLFGPVGSSEGQQSGQAGQSGGGAGGGGGSRQPAAPNSGCFSPNWLQQKGITLQQKAAQKIGHPFGFGAGISAGAGFAKVFGLAGTASAQMVVSPNGNAFLVYTYGGSGLTTP